jgi:hypothetical protein
MGLIGKITTTQQRHRLPTLKSSFCAFYRAENSRSRGVEISPEEFLASQKNLLF